MVCGWREGGGWRICVHQGLLRQGAATIISCGRGVFSRESEYILHTDTDAQRKKELNPRVQKGARSEQDPPRGNLWTQHSWSVFKEAVQDLVHVPLQRLAHVSANKGPDVISMYQVTGDRSTWFEGFGLQRLHLRVNVEQTSCWC